MIGERLVRLRTFLQAQQADGIIVMQPENLRYFSGFTGGEGALVVTSKVAVLWTDSRYTEQAVSQSGSWYTISNHQGRLTACMAQTLNDAGVQHVLYESNFLTHFAYEQIASQTSCRFTGLNLNVLRAVKEPYELAATRKASAIADKAFAELLPFIRPGVTEKELGARLESNMLLAGSEEKSFTTIVASGVRSSMPHGTASPKVIEKGDFVTFDFGAVWEGYHSDITRTVVVGKASDEQKAFYQMILEAQQLGVAAVRAGALKKDIDGLVRDFFAKHDRAQYFTHALGHGTGLEIHEEPVLAPRSSGVLAENMIVTVEPGLYIEGKYGVRIEDSVAVTADGCEILTKTPKELMELL